MKTEGRAGGRVEDANPNRKLSPSRRLTWWRYGVGVALLVLLLVFVDPRELYQVLRQASATWVAVTFAVATAWLFLGGLNVWILLRCLAPVKLRLFISIYITSWAASNVIPGQLGDATQVLLLRQYGVSVATSSAAYLVDKFVSLVWMLMVATFGIGLVTPAISRWWALALPFVALLAASIGLSVLRRLPSRENGIVARAQHLLERLVEQMALFRRVPGKIALNILLTIGKWIVVGVKYLTAFYAFGAAPSFAETATIPIMSSLIGYVPITVGGIGTTEWTAVALFDRVGVATSVVLSVYLFLRAALFLVALALLAAFRPDVESLSLEREG